MSKKKSFSGSTMTLKDFHGGSIPSDLSLPSAPGLSARAPERPAAWGAAARSDHGLARPRPGSAGARGIDDRAPLPFLPRGAAHIGRHFDEDERGPFSGLARPSSRPVSSPAAPGPWAVRREEPPPVAWSPGPVAASRLVQASAVEKVASGRWQSRPPPDVEVIQFQEVDGLDRRINDSVRIAGDRDHGIEKEGERAPVQLEVKERTVVRLYSDGPRPMSSEGRFGGPQLNQHAAADLSECPKLRILSRSKLVESSETRSVNDKQVYQPASETVRAVNAQEMHGSGSRAKLVLVGADGGSQPAERPRLNLKPRSQPLEQSDHNSGRERKSLFGGARPRELVLKERGINPSNDVDVTVPVNRVRHDIPKTEPKQDPVAPIIRFSERIDNFFPERRNARDLERKNYRHDLEKMDVQGSSWKNDNRKNTREIEKPLQLRREEPDTWRKPVEEPKPNTPGLRFGKAASALELAQAFSRSVSDTQLSMPGRSKVFFSRLTDSRELYAGRPQRQINGY